MQGGLAKPAGECFGNPPRRGATSREWLVVKARRTVFLLWCSSHRSLSISIREALPMRSVTRRHGLGFLVLENKEFNRDSMTMTTAIASSMALASAAGSERGNRRQSTAFFTPPHLPPSIS